MNANTNSANRAIVSGGSPPSTAVLRQLTPCHARADTVGRQQGVHRSALTSLTAAEVVGAVESGSQRRAGIGVLRTGSQLQEGAQAPSERRPRSVGPSAR